MTSLYLKNGARHMVKFVLDSNYVENKLEMLALIVSGGMQVGSEAVKG